MGSNEIAAEEIENDEDDLDLSQHLVEQVSKQYLSPKNSDITFCVDTERIPAHRYFLALRSEYFQTLIFSGPPEKFKREIVLNVPLEPFKAVLRYIYSGRISIARMNKDMVLKVLNLSNIYGLSELITALCEHLTKDLTMDSLSELLEITRQYASRAKLLTAACHNLADRCAADFLQHKSFQTLSQVSISLPLL